MKRESKAAESRRITLLVLRDIFLWIDVAILLFPLIYMILSSGKTQLELAQNPFGLPSSWAQFGENYGKVISGKKNFSGIEVQIFTPYFAMIKNSAILTLLGLLFLVVGAAPIGYVLGARQFPGKRPIMLFVIFIQTVPLFGYLIAFYFLMDRWGMINNQVAIAMVYAAVSMPSTILYLKGFYTSFPKEVEEAAKLDGASELQRYFLVVIPNSISIIFALILVQFMGYWNEFALTNLLTDELSLKTISITLMSVGDDDYNYTMALMVLSAIPMFIFFTVFQKQIVNSNVTMGAVKG